MKQKKSKILFAILVVGGLVIYFYMKKNNNTEVTAIENQTESANTTNPPQKNQPTRVAKNASVPQKNAPPVSTSRSPAEDSLNQKITSFLYKWRPQSEFKINMNQPHNQFEVRGGEFLIEKSSELDFAQQLTEVIGSSKNSIQRLSGADATAHNTSFSEVIEYSQHYKSYVIENSSLKIFRKNDDQRVYFITSSLKPPFTLNDTIQVNRDQASASLTNDFSQSRNPSVKVMSQQPVVYYEGQAPELCWKFSLSLAAPVEERQVYVSVSTGEVISSTYSLDH